jgi:hypothetical protein
MGELGKEGSIFLVVGRMWLVLRMGKILASQKTPSSSSVLPQAVRWDTTEKRCVHGKIDEDWALDLSSQCGGEKNYSEENGINKCQISLKYHLNNGSGMKRI